MSRVDSVLRVAASHGLGPLPSPRLEVTATGLPTVLARVHTERLVGLLDQAVADGALLAGDDTALAVGQAAVRAQAWTLLVERHHLEVHGILSGAGIEHRFLKGASTAHRFYEHPGLRTFRDVDVLVHGDDLEAAARVLQVEGHTRPIPELVAGFDRRYGKSVDLRAPSGIEVDLHRTLAPGPFGVPTLEPLWARPADSFSVGGARLPTLDPIAAFVHACIHAVTGARTVLATLRDVVAAAPGDVYVADAEALATRLGATACVAEACTRAADALDHAPAMVNVLAGWPIPRRQRAWLDLYVDRPGYRRVAWATVGALPGPSRKARYLVVLARAQRAHRRSRQGGVGRRAT